jgi:hypothetical protein
VFEVVVEAAAVLVVELALQVVEKLEEIIKQAQELQPQLEGPLPQTKLGIQVLCVLMLHLSQVFTSDQSECTWCITHTTTDIFTTMDTDGTFTLKQAATTTEQKKQVAVLEPSSQSSLSSAAVAASSDIFSADMLVMTKRKKL